MSDTSGYIATFASILFGLAVTDVAYSFHRLIRARERVRFHWLPLMVAAFVEMVLIATWWGYYYAFDRPDTTVQGFVPFAVSMLFLVLIAAASLPDDVPEKLDLEQFYFAQHRYFWGLFAAYVSWILFRDIVFLRVASVMNMLWPIASLAALLALAWTPRKWVHVLLVPLIFARQLWIWLPRDLA